MVISSLRAGGAEKIFAFVANHWAACDHDVSVILLEGEAPFYEMNKSVAVTRLGLMAPSQGALNAMANNARRLGALRRALKHTRPSAIVSFMTEVNVLTILAAAGTGIPVMVCERVDPFANLEKKSWRLLRRVAYPFAARIVTQTKGAARYYEGWGRGGVAVIPNTIGPAINAHPAAQTDAGDVIVAMGRLEPQKGFDLLLNAFGKIKETHPGWKLSIYGGGTERTALERQRAALGLENRVEFHGKTADPAGAFRSAKIFVLSSRFEGFPNVLLEAMAGGLAVAAFDCPWGPGEIIRNGADGLLVPPGDVDALAGVMDRLITDVDLRLRLSSAASQVTERFSTARVMAMWDELLRPGAA